MNGMEAYLAGAPLVAVGAAFASGILAGLSPCVYPMIPIVTGYIGGRAVKDRAICEHCSPVANMESVVAGTAGERTRARYFILSLGYVAGMAAVYSLLGMIAALTGDLFGRISTSPWALLFVANIFILFATGYDHTFEIGQAFKVRGVPTVFLVDSKGIVRYKNPLLPDDIEERIKKLRN